MIFFVICVASNSSPKKHSLNITGMSTLKMIFLAPCVTKHSERKSILLIKSSTNAQKRNLCSLTLYLNDPECSYHTTSVSNLNAQKKRVDEKTVKCECYSTVGYIYMTSLHCVFPLSLSDVSSLLKNQWVSVFVAWTRTVQDHFVSW